MKRSLLQLTTLTAIASSAMLAASPSFAHHHAAATAMPTYKGAVEAAPCFGIRDGFYVGAEGGYDAYNAKRSATFTDVGGDAVNLSRRLSATGWVGGAFAGYGHYFDRFYLGGEAWYFGANPSGNESETVTRPTTATMISNSSKISVDHEYGVAVLPGFRVNDASLFYARLGYQWAKFNGTETASVGTATTSASNSTTRGGFAFGVGSELAIFPVEGLNLRTDYIHTWYTSFSGATAFNSTYNVGNNEFLLGLSYHFC